MFFGKCLAICTRSIKNVPICILSCTTSRAVLSNLSDSVLEHYHSAVYDTEKSEKAKCSNFRTS